MFVAIAPRPGAILSDPSGIKKQGDKAEFSKTLDKERRAAGVTARLQCPGQSEITLDILKRVRIEPIPLPVFDLKCVPSVIEGFLKGFKCGLGDPLAMRVKIDSEIMRLESLILVGRNNQVVEAGVWTSLRSIEESGSIISGFGRDLRPTNDLQISDFKVLGNRLHGWVRGCK